MCNVVLRIGEKAKKKCQTSTENTRFLLFLPLPPNACIDDGERNKTEWMKARNNVELRVTRRTKKENTRTGEINKQNLGELIRIRRKAEWIKVKEARYPFFMCVGKKYPIFHSHKWFEHIFAFDDLFAGFTMSFFFTFSKPTKTRWRSTPGFSLCCCYCFFCVFAFCCCTLQKCTDPKQETVGRGMEKSNIDKILEKLASLSYINVATSYLQHIGNTTDNEKNKRKSECHLSSEESSDPHNTHTWP